MAPSENRPLRRRNPKLTTARFHSSRVRRRDACCIYWGSAVVGRYRVFDARVLAAINTALGEANSAFVLKEPKLGTDLAFAVACEEAADGYHLSGHATFDVVLGYGRFDAATDPAILVRLGESVRRALTMAVAQLGWDMQRLCDPYYAPVLEALYGLPAAVPANPPTTRDAPIELELDLHGPFAAGEGTSTPCLFSSDCARLSGIYLWTVEVEGRYHVWYVGQTRRSFAERTGEHISNMLSGRYALPALDALVVKGEHQLDWRDDAGHTRWPATLPNFLARAHELVPRALQLIDATKFWVVPMAQPARVISRVEGALGRHFRGHTDPVVRHRVTPGLILPGKIAGEPTLTLHIRGGNSIAGLTPTLRDE